MWNCYEAFLITCLRYLTIKKCSICVDKACYTAVSLPLNQLWKMKEQEGEGGEWEKKKIFYNLCLFVSLSEWYHAKQKTGIIFLIMHIFKHTQK